MVSLPSRQLLALAAGIALLAGCASVTASPSRPAQQTSAGTLGGVGILPSTIDSRPSDATSAASTSGPARGSPSTKAPATGATGAPDATGATGDPISGAGSSSSSSSTLDPNAGVGGRATGNRILMIGDSVLASTSSRYSNDMCNALVPLGWKVELDAEVGRFIDFGKEVLDKRLGAGWDVGVIFLGSNYGDNLGVYANDLDALVERLSPNPVVLVTVTEFTPNRAEVNAVIRLIAASRPNVTVLDWATISKAAPGLLGGDGLHLTTSGRNSLALSMAATLGPAPQQPGDCLTTSYRDDSAGSVESGTTLPHQTRSTTRPTTRSTTRSTTRPTTRPTVPAVGSATTTTAKASTGSTVAPATSAAEPAKTTSPTQQPVPQTTEPPVKTTAEPPKTVEPQTTSGPGP
jgi:hypothetical protein